MEGLLDLKIGCVRNFHASVEERPSNPVKGTASVMGSVQGPANEVVLRQGLSVPENKIRESLLRDSFSELKRKTLG